MDKGTSALILSRLATEVKEAQDADPLHGPENEKRSHLVGVEYEVVLELQLRALGTHRGAACVNSFAPNYLLLTKLQSSPLRPKPPSETAARLERLTYCLPSRLEFRFLEMTVPGWIGE